MNRLPVESTLVLAPAVEKAREPQQAVWGVKGGTIDDTTRSPVTSFRFDLVARVANGAIGAASMARGQRATEPSAFEEVAVLLVGARLAAEALKRLAKQTWR